MSESPAQRARRALLRKRKADAEKPAPIDPRDPFGAEIAAEPKPTPKPERTPIRDSRGEIVGYTVGPSPFGPDTPLPDAPGATPHGEGARAAAATLKGRR